MDIINKTSAPLAIPLPGGKKLRLGPGRKGQIAPKATSHPPVKALIDTGDIEIVGGGGKHSIGGDQPIPGSGTGRVSGGGIRHTGDR